MKKRIVDYGMLFGLCILAIFCVIKTTLTHEPEKPSPLHFLEFTGEYSYDGNQWNSLQQRKDMFAIKGDFYLRGSFEQEIPAGAFLTFYNNHIGASISINGKNLFTDWALEKRALGMERSLELCGKYWSSIETTGISPEDLIEIYIYNPHEYGNRTAYEDFLSTLCFGPDPSRFDMLQKSLNPYGEPFRVLGGLLLIIAVIMFGSTVAATILQAPLGTGLLKRGIFTLCVSGYFVFDTIDISLWNDSIVVNTYLYQLCMMLSGFCIVNIACDYLTGHRKTIGVTAMYISAGIDVAIIAMALVNNHPIFDLGIYWFASQIVVCPVMIGCCVLQLRKIEKRHEMIMMISGAVLFTTILMDIFGVADNALSHGTCSKTAFIVLLVIHIIFAAKEVLASYHARQYARQLEKELEDSRVRIMLSQLQPHFIFNVLNTIYYLCGKDPAAARLSIDKFSTYLRNNLDSLTQKELILFKQEMDHVQIYLELEKIRFEDDLSVVYDIEATSFQLPVLTVQSIVENAVKHGITKKRGGGTVRIVTREEKLHYRISVTDTGIGFDQTKKSEDGRNHVGIQNVRARLESMVNGKLLIESVPGKGTVVTVLIPKKGEE